VDHRPEEKEAVNLKTILFWLLIALIIWFVIEDPHTVAQWTHDVGQFLTSAAHGLSNFFASI
jgi:hypothetical protein